MDLNKIRKGSYLKRLRFETTQMMNEWLDEMQEKARLAWDLGEELPETAEAIRGWALRVQRQQLALGTSWPPPPGLGSSEPAAD